MDQTPPLLLGLAGYMLLRRHGPNPWIGVRLPWTFTDREIWDKSWLLAVVMLVAMGLGALFSWTLLVVSITALQSGVCNAGRSRNFKTPANWPELIARPAALF